MIDDIDPRGLILESYRIENITEADCRSIFFDWALGASGEGDMALKIGALVAYFAADKPDHPMSVILHEALSEPKQKGRRGGWRTRQRT